ncbi:cysteine hydrolase family protein [Shouchella lonarensis]|uniref:Nicotinamidase-related amidase n=1 Tax=Shouchella lonarensis TaxID=1464122 RepID=A0A1G6NEN9_9BACI|nr:cysteine hydrolase family protein [Shouchella lonarensis]SDC66330.1 Nicotinamidase-related amidase [Shouchella lonarensis]
MNSALLLVDVQQAFDDPKWGQRNHHDAEKNIALLLGEWRKKKAPVIHIQHHSTRRHSLFYHEHPGFSFKNEAQPINGEEIFRKQVNSAFIGTGLTSYLRKQHIAALTIAGFTTPHCVSTTARMSANLGFQTTVVSDATVAFPLQWGEARYTAEQVHEASLLTLHEEFATITLTKSLIKGREESWH